MKPFKTLQEQVDLLKSRGLHFEDEADSMFYLLGNNYYNVVNYYSKFFMHSNNYYISDCNFNHIVALHHFDKELKSLLFKYIIEAEKHFKSVLAYRYAEYFKNQPYAFLNITNYDSVNNLKAAIFIASLSNIISSNHEKSTPNSIKHYVNKYNDVPIWILVNFLTFGQTSKLYSYIPARLKNTIAKDMALYINQNFNISNSKLTPEQLQNYLYNIVELRNIIAHDNKLLDYSCKQNTKYHSTIHVHYSILKNSPRQSVFDVIILLHCFLPKRQYAQLHNTLVKRIKRLKGQIPSTQFDSVINSLGIPSNLQTIPQ